MVLLDLQVFQANKEPQDSQDNQARSVRLELRERLVPVVPPELLGLLATLVLKARLE
jgi:hypothetical protein